MIYEYQIIKGMEKILNLDETFSWDKISSIEAIDYSISKDDFSSYFSIMTLNLRFQIENDIYELLIKFSSVVDLNLRRIGGEHNQICGFEISDKSKDGWEKNQRFFVDDYEDGVISFYCKDIEVLTVNKLGK